MLRLSNMFAFALVLSAIVSVFSNTFPSLASENAKQSVDHIVPLGYTNFAMQKTANATYDIEEKEYTKQVYVYKPVVYVAAKTSYDSEIEAAAAKYGADANWMKRVMQCESRGNPNAVNRYSNASGLYQFLPSTWRTTPYGSSNIFDANAQINAAAWMYSQGRAREWSCK